MQTVPSRAGKSAVNSQGLVERMRGLRFGRETCESQVPCFGYLTKMLTVNFGALLSCWARNALTFVENRYERGRDKKNCRRRAAWAQAENAVARASLKDRPLSLAARFLAYVHVLASIDTLLQFAKRPASFCPPFHVRQKAGFLWKHCPTSFSETLRRSYAATI